MTINKPQISVLLYHQIGNNPNLNTNLNCFCSIEDFENQMEFLKVNNIKVISLEEACDLNEKRQSIFTPHVVLSFDDGCESFYKIVHPILKKFGFNAVLYPVAGYLGNYATWKNIKNSEIKIMDSEMLIELKRIGYEIGSHTIDHIKLSTLSKEEAYYQIMKSKVILEEILNEAIISFSYPHGDYNSETIEILKECGFKNAVTCQNKYFDYEASKFEIPRKYITYKENIPDFSAKILK